MELTPGRECLETFDLASVGQPGNQSFSEQELFMTRSDPCQSGLDHVEVPGPPYSEPTLRTRSGSNSKMSRRRAGHGRQQ